MDARATIPPVFDRPQLGRDHPWLGAIVEAIDKRLRNRDGVGEFSTSPGCILRIRVVESRDGLAFSDGARVHPGDRIVDLPFCPDCEESLAQGQGASLVIRAQKLPCAICDRLGSVPFRTAPLHGETVLEMYLCGEHFRALLGRRLGPLAFQVLQRRLDRLHLNVEQIFLLHDGFYDALGRALQPIDDLV